jgi:hypothetical protein
MRRDRRDATLRDWARAIPEEIIAQRPVLAMGLVGVTIEIGELDRVEARLAAIEEWSALPPDVRSAAGCGCCRARSRCTAPHWR